MPITARRPCLESLEDRIALASIRGVCFNDLNADGIRNYGEAVTPGRTVFLDRDADAVLDAEEARAVSGPDGGYVFNDVAAGTYLVTQVLPSGWLHTRQSVTVPPVNLDDADRLIRLDKFKADPRFTGIDGRGTSVAVLDTGIDADHPFFAGGVGFQYDFADDDGVAEDIDGHGTHVAGVIASRDAQYPGVAPGTRVIGLKVLDDAGNGSFASVERGLQWVIANASRYNIVSVNMSFGDGGNYGRPMDLHGIGDELRTLAARNVVVVAASGNGHVSGESLSGIMYPAADHNVIPVGAVWDADHGGPWTWDGDVTDYETGPDRIVSFAQRTPGLGEVFAPGAMMTSAAPGGDTATLSGTSVAAGVVSGVVALAQQTAKERIGRQLTTAEVRSLLQSTGKLIRDGDDERDNVVNTNAYYRRIDVLALGEAILKLGSTAPTGRAGVLTVTVKADQVVRNANLGSKERNRNQAPALATELLNQTQNEDDVRARGVSVGMILGAAYRDPDAVTRRGVAVVGGTTAAGGVWQVSSDYGATWRVMDVPTPSAAVLLREGDRLRFLPDLDFNGTVRLDFRAWDGSSGTAGGMLDLTQAGAVGGSSSVGVHVRSVKFTIRPVNDAPTLTRAARFSTVPVNAVSPRGDRVADLLAGKFADADGPVAAGMAVIGTTGRGVWQVSSDGVRWAALAGVGSARAFLAGPDDRLRFVPAAGWSGTASLSYRVWDRTTGARGATVNLQSWNAVGGSSAYSDDAASGLLSVGGVTISVQAGPTVAEVLAAEGVRLRPGEGVALLSLTGYGRWSYSLDGASWQPLTAPSRAAARLVPGSAYLRFVPLPGYSAGGRLAYQRWDGRTGNAGSAMDVSSGTAAGVFAGVASMDWPVVG